MRLRKRKKHTNKEITTMLEGLEYELLTTQSQLGTLTQVFSDFLDYTHKKAKFLEYLKDKQAKPQSGSVEDNEVKQEPVEAV